MSAAVGATVHHAAVREIAVIDLATTLSLLHCGKGAPGSCDVPDVDNSNVTWGFHDCASQLHHAGRTDKQIHVLQALAPVEIDSEEAADELAEDLGLPLTVDGTGRPVDFPAAAPFSRAVPSIVTALHRCSLSAVCTSCPASHCAAGPVLHLAEHLLNVLHSKNLVSTSSSNACPGCAADMWRRPCHTSPASSAQGSW